MTQRGMYPGAQKSPNGVQGDDPIGGLVNKAFKLILILEMDVKSELLLSRVINTMASL